MLDVNLHFKHDRDPKYHIKRAVHRGSVQTIQNPHEWDYFITYLENNHTINSMLEVGTAWGGAIYGYANIASDDATIITIDDNSKNCKFEDLKDKENHISGYLKGNQKIHFIHKDSHSEECELELNGILNNNKVDFLFIDGDHSYDGVKSDFNMYSKYVREGGIIGFHDVAGFDEQEGVKRFWDETKDKYNHLEILWCTRRMGIGVLHYTENLNEMEIDANTTQHTRGKLSEIGL